MASAKPVEVSIDVEGSIYLDELIESTKAFVERLEFPVQHGHTHQNTFQMRAAWDREFEYKPSYFYTGLTTEKEKEKPKMYAFHVILIDKTTDVIVYETSLVASNKETAERKAFQEYLRDGEGTVDVENLHFSTMQFSPGYSK